MHIDVENLIGETPYKSIFYLSDEYNREKRKLVIFDWQRRQVDFWKSNLAIGGYGMLS